MMFGLNEAQYSHVVRYTNSYAVYFKVGQRSAHIHIGHDTDNKVVLNLLWALELPLDSEDPAFTIFSQLHYGKQLYVFLHYQDKIDNQPYTFLHIPGTLKDGRVFDRKKGNYIAYIDNDGSLVYIDPTTKDRSLISRNAAYMKSMHVQAQGTITVKKTT